MRKMLALLAGCALCGCCKPQDERTNTRPVPPIAASPSEVPDGPTAKGNGALSFGIANSFSGKLSPEEDRKVPKTLRGAFYIESLRETSSADLAKEREFKTQVAEERRDGVRYVALEDFRHVQFSDVVSGMMTVIEPYRIIAD